MGQILARKIPLKVANAKYKIRQGATCITCRHFGRCTKATSGRPILRHELSELKDKINSFYESDKGQRIYQKRGQKVEYQFGHIKRNMGVSSFLLRGFSGVKAEKVLLSLFSV